MGNKMSSNAIFKIHYNLDVNYDCIMGETINFVSDLDAIAYKYNGNVYMVNEIMYPDKNKTGLHISKVLPLTEMNEELRDSMKKFVEEGKDFPITLLTYASPKTIMVTLNVNSEYLDETYEKMYDQIVDNIGIASEDDIDDYILCEAREGNDNLVVFGDDDGGFTCIGLYKNYSFTDLFVEKDPQAIKYNLLSNDEICKLLYED